MKSLIQTDVGTQRSQSCLQFNFKFTWLTEVGNSSHKISASQDNENTNVKKLTSQNPGNYLITFSALYFSKTINLIMEVVRL